MKNITRLLLICSFAAFFAVRINAQPNPPKILTATVQNWGSYQYVKLAWQGDPRMTAMSNYYSIYRKDGAVADTGSFKKIFDHIRMTNWIDKFVRKGFTYSYFVTETDHSGESKGSDTAQVTLDSVVTKAVVTGTLKDDVSGKAIVHGRVSIIPVFGWGLTNVFTDSLGEFSAHVFPGTYLLYSSAPGYFPEYYNNVFSIRNATKITLSSGDSLNFNIGLLQRTPSQKFALSGSVLDSLNNPLKALIEVYNVTRNTFTHRAYHTVTDSLGKYSVSVNQGDTVVVYAHSINHNYISEFYNNKPTFLEADRIPITQNVSDINFVLSHKPVYNNGISGNVTSGDTVTVHAIIHAIRLSTNDDRTHRRYSTATDSLGSYSFSHLIPGNYILFAIPQDDFKPTFFRYDSTQTMNWKDADSVVVGDSGIIAGINFHVEAHPDSGANEIDGAVTDNSGNPVNGALVYAQDENQVTYSFAVSDQNGKFSIAGLIPGNYTVASSSYGYTGSQTSNISLDYNTSFSSTASFTLTPESVTAVNETPGVIRTFTLNQNYPNPFNPSTVISYQIPYESKVTLKVYNILGSEVATLINDVKPAGNYNITFNASGLASGIYFYQLRSGNFVATKKLILMK